MRSLSKTTCRNVVIETATNGVDLRSCVTGLCTLSGTNLSALAKDAGFSLSHFTNQLKGNRSLSGRTATTLKNNFGVDIVSLYEENT